MDDESKVARLEAELDAARAEARAWKERHDALADNSTDVISRIDAAGRVTYVSPAIRKLLGYEPEDLVGQQAFGFVDPSQEAERREGFARRLEGGTAPTVTVRVRRKDGAWVWMEYRTQPLHDERGAVVGFQSISHDVTERREAEEARLQADREFESFVRAMPVPVVMQRDTKIVLVNRAFTASFGHAEEDLVGRPVLHIIDPADQAYIAARLSEGIDDRVGVPTREHMLRDAAGTPCPVDATVIPVRLRGERTEMAVIRDLRERKRLEAQLITADRMASLGRLAAAVGHEVNNPLAWLLGSITLIEREIARLGELGEAGRVLRDLVANVREGAERIRTVVRDLRALSRQSGDVATPIDLAHLLDLTAAMADHEVRHRARLVKSYDKLPPVLGSEARLGQVFLNLLVNAAQAIPEGDVRGNEVRIEARALEGGRVAVDVVDSGVGIEPAIAERIFEPFFTTKPGEGTGIGLSISRHIVAAMGGSIALVPSEARGTRFRVILPCAPDDAPHVATLSSEPPALDGSSFRVLVVDDEPTLAYTIAKLLRPRRVDVALGGREALERLLGDAAYDVVLCDLQMPDLSGMDVFEQVRRARPGFERRIVFMTGGALNARAAELVATSECPVLDKPFDATALASAIATVRTR